MTTVVTSAARRRWAAVAVGVTALVAGLGLGPRALSAVGVAPTEAGPDAVVARALASATVAYSATGESRGSLALPDLRGFGDLAALLGGTTRTRVWWDTPTRWRVDVVDALGERDTYGQSRSSTIWDYENRRLVTVVGDPSARLPRAQDLVAPEAARRLLAAVGPRDRIDGLPARRVGGRVTDGVLVLPSDARSTIARAEVWVDRESGLPLRLTVTDRRGDVALETSLDGVRLGRPAADVLTPPGPAIARRSLDRSPDLLAGVADQNPWRLPDRLAGLPATDPAAAGAATYGDGLVAVAVVPLPPRVARDVVTNATRAGSAAQEVDGGSVVRIGSSLLNVALAVGSDRAHAYVVTGLVDPALLDAVAADLFRDPPPLRDQG